MASVAFSIAFGLLRFSRCIKVRPFISVTHSDFTIYRNWTNLFREYKLSRAEIISWVFFFREIRSVITFEEPCESISFRRFIACLIFFHLCRRCRRTSLLVSGSSIPSHWPREIHKCSSRLLVRSFPLLTYLALIISLSTSVKKSDGISGSLILFTIASRINVSNNNSSTEIFYLLSTLCNPID